MIIYLVRHGKTYCNENKLYCGISDVPLSEEGKKELEEKRKSVSLPICKRNFTSEQKELMKHLIFYIQIRSMKS